MTTTTKSPLTRANWLREATARLKQASIDSAELDSLILLEDATGINRAHLLADTNTLLTKSELSHLETALKKRLNHEPIAYIRNIAWFYGRSYYVDNSVLIPRPDSEAFIDVLKSIDIEKCKTLIDLGSGSGCLGISAKLEFPKLKVGLYEKSPRALVVSIKNAANLDSKVSHHFYDLKDSKLPGVDIILANLPYVPTKLEVSKDVGFEPKMALFSGDDGLDLYKIFWAKLSELSNPPKLVLTESLKSQHSEMVKIAKSNGYRLSKTLGLVQLFSRQT
jgi:release factor glutamine methyltransferase